MSIGGGYSESKSKSQNNSASQNIGTALLANLFGQGARFGQGGMVFTNDIFGAQPRKTTVNRTAGPGQVGFGFGGGNSGFGLPGGTSTATAGQFNEMFGGGNSPASPFVSGTTNGTSNPGAAGGGGPDFDSLTGGGTGIPGDPMKAFFGSGNTTPSLSITQPGVSRGFQFANPAFGPGDFDVLGNLKFVEGDTGLDQESSRLADFFSESGLGRMLGEFGIENLQANTDAVSDGFRTDMSPIIDMEQRRLQRETLPDFAEQFSGLTGGFSTDFMQAGANAGADMGSNLAGMQVGLDEAAAERRLRATQSAPTSAAAGITAPGASLLALNQDIREDAFQRRPEVQLLRNLSMLFNIGSPANASGGNSSSSSTSGQASAGYG